MARSNRRIELVSALVTAVFLVTLVFIPASSVTSAQKRAKAQRPTRQQSTPAPSPTPKSDWDALGEPPPMPSPSPVPTKEPEVNPGDVISVNTTEVMLPVTVRDTSGRLVSNLTQHDFRVF